MTSSRSELIKHVQSVTGVLPHNLNQTLAILTHPDVIVETKRYFNTVDTGKSLRCTIYQDPWDCHKETEAKYETIYYGIMEGIGFDEAWRENWCQNCKDRVTVL